MYTLVIARTHNCRRLLVRNLTIRGYLAVGVNSLVEARRLVEKLAPNLVVLCEAAAIPEDEVGEVRALPALAAVPLVVVTQEAPAPGWLKKWNIASCLPVSAGVLDLIRRLEPWLLLSASGG